MCVYLWFYVLFSLIGCAGLVGIFSGEPGHVHIRVCEFPRCGVPGQYEYIWSLSWCGWRGGTDFFLALVLAGTVRLNRWGWRDSTDFLVSLALFRRVRYD